MPHKSRKIRKKRGSRTQGYGRVGQHRKGGTKGFRKAGRHKGGWSWVLRYEPDYFNKKGFNSPKKNIKTKIINCCELEEMAIKLFPKKRKNLFLDLEKEGYTKLLGRGKITRPINVKVYSCSKSALIKIKEHGGKVEIIEVPSSQGEKI
jgi:large subunit ribosomal protein L15